MHMCLAQGSSCNHLFHPPHKRPDLAAGAALAVAVDHVPLRSGQVKVFEGACTLEFLHQLLHR